MDQNNTGINVNFTQALAIAEICMAADRPLYMHGGPGIGKTAIPRLIAKKRNLPCIIINAPQLDPVDLRGVPSVVDGLTRWNPPEALCPKTPEGILMIDELPSAVPAVQVASFQLWLEKAIGDFTLPKGWKVFGAGNRAMDNSIVYDLPSPLRNRIVQIHLNPHVSEWLAWARASDIDRRIVAFLQAQQNWIYAEANTKTEAYPTPRSWEILSDLIKQPGADALMTELAIATVGQRAGQSFADHTSKTGLSVSTEEIRRDPKNCTIPPATELYMLVKALAKSATEKTIFGDVAFLRRLNEEFRQKFLLDVAPSLVVKYKEWM